jgi:hypothetical protein
MDLIATEQVLIALASAVIGGALTSVAAFAALRVELRYLMKDVDRIDATAQRAHHRLDVIERDLAPAIAAAAVEAAIGRGFAAR